MLDSMNSNNLNSTVSNGSSPSLVLSTHNDYADTLIKNIQKQENLENQALVNSEDNNDANHRTLAQKLVREEKAGNTMAPSSSQDLKDRQSSVQDVVNQAYLRGLETNAAADDPSAKMGVFLTFAPPPWESSKAALEPEYIRAMDLNPFVKAVRGSLVSKIAGLALLPATIPTLWVLLGGRTKSDEARSAVSLAQNKFVINGIQDGSILDFSTKVKNGIRFLNGIELASINAEPNLSLKFAGLLLEKAMDLEGRTLYVPEEGVAKPHIFNKVEERHIAAATKLLDELNEFLTKDPKDIASSVGEHGGPFALKAIVQTVSGVPALLEAKHAGPKVDPLIKTFITEKEAEKHLKILDRVGGFFKNILGLQAKQVETAFEKARKSSQEISERTARDILAQFAETVNDPENRQHIKEAKIDLGNLVNELAKTVSGKANEQFNSKLADVDKAMAAAARAKNAHLN
jgi:hypothetical protein